jgi:aminoglycoside 3-N-acetyltransferase
VSLEATISATERPATIESLAADLAALGVMTGCVLMVHSSLSQLGYVSGGAPAVIAALDRVVGSAGTLVMPTHSSDLSDPAEWREPAVPAAWHQMLRDTLPAYDPATTPTWAMGAIAENFRTHPDVQRSQHPRQSFAARGPRAAIIVVHHALDCAMGERSPLGRLYDLDARILLLGVGHDRNTSLHLAEHRTRWSGKKTAVFGSPVTIECARRWLVVEDLAYDDSDFGRLGADFERDMTRVTIGRVATATARLMPMRGLVDYAARWMERHRP